MSCLQCDFTEVLEESRPPDPEMMDLIEKAFLEGQIDGLTAELAHIFLIWHRDEQGFDLSKSRFN